MIGFKISQIQIAARLVRVATDHPGNLDYMTPAKRCGIMLHSKGSAEAYELRVSQYNTNITLAEVNGDIKRLKNKTIKDIDYEYLPGKIIVTIVCGPRTKLHLVFWVNTNSFTKNMLTLRRFKRY